MLQDKPYFSIDIKENGERSVALNEGEFVFTPSYHENRFANKREVMVREKVARLLLESSKKLPPGYKFMILDAWRSEQAQQNMIDRFRREIQNKNPTCDEQQIYKKVLKFAAPVTHDPKSPPPHSTGGAVDLTVVDNAGNELEMGGEFDKLTEKSYFNFYKNRKASKEKIFHKNRQLLRTMLTRGGFAPNDNEWWHFDYGNQRWAYYYKKPFAYYGSIKS